MRPFVPDCNKKADPSPLADEKNPARGRVFRQSRLIERREEPQSLNMFNIAHSETKRLTCFSRSLENTD
jgi:hypothetical protein